MLQTYTIHPYTCVRYCPSVQVLELPLVSNGLPDHYYLVPSFVGRYTPGYLTAPSPPGSGQSSEDVGGDGSMDEADSPAGAPNGRGGARASGANQEITGWSITNVRLRCMPKRDADENLNMTLLEWQQADKSTSVFL